MATGMGSADRPSHEAFAGFSHVAMTSVVVGAGVVNALVRLIRVDGLCRAGYGRLLIAKLVLAAALVVTGVLTLTAPSPNRPGDAGPRQHAAHPGAFP